MTISYKTRKQNYQELQIKTKDKSNLSGTVLRPYHLLSAFKQMA